MSDHSTIQWTDATRRLAIEEGERLRLALLEDLRRELIPHPTKLPSRRRRACWVAIDHARRDAGAAPLSEEEKWRPMGPGPGTLAELLTLAAALEPESEGPATGTRRTEATVVKARPPYWWPDRERD